MLAVPLHGEDVATGAIGTVTTVLRPRLRGKHRRVVPCAQHHGDDRLDVIIAGGTGPRAIEMFSGFGIGVATGRTNEISIVASLARLAAVTHSPILGA